MGLLSGTKGIGQSGYNIFKNAWSSGIIPGIGKAGWSGLKLGYNTMNWSLRNPGSAIALGAGAYGMYSLANSGPQGSNLSKKDMEALAIQNGIPSTGFDYGMGASVSQDSRAMFMNSTMGLTQGLHKNRHRG